MRVCAVEGCERKAHARGWCGKHYLRWWQTGSLKDPVRPTLADRFWPKVNKCGPGACWMWTASLDRKGYGQFMLDGRPKRAHRIAYELVIGAIPTGMQLDHLCRNRRCVNPAHLEPVTNMENALRGSKAIPCVHGQRSHRQCEVCRRTRSRKTTA